MKKVFLFLWCGLFGCSIIPDDSFEKTPTPTLAKIHFSSNDMPDIYGDPEIQHQVLDGEVSQEENGYSISFAGDLDPFWFVEKVSSIKYGFNDQNLLSSLLLTFESGETQVEEFSYNESDSLQHVEIRYSSGTSDYEYSYEFFYVDAYLDSIGKTVTVTEGANVAVDKGYYKRTQGQGGYYFNTFYSIYPYTQGQSVSHNSISCDYTGSDTKYSFFEFSKSHPFNYFRYETFVKRDGVFIGENNFSILTAIENPLTGAQKSFSTAKVSPYSSSGTFIMGNNTCIPYVHAVSYYRLVPRYSANYAILEMLNIAEERDWVNRQPERLSKYYDIEVEFEYNYAN